MMKTIVFKALALGLLSYAWVSGHSVEAAPRCPAFTAAMVDATWMATDFSQLGPIVGDAEDDPREPLISCTIFFDVGDAFFEIFVGGGEALVKGIHPRDSPFDDDFTELRTRVFGLTPKQERGCIAQVVQSFVWRQFYTQLLP